MTSLLGAQGSLELYYCSFLVSFYCGQQLSVSLGFIIWLHSPTAETTHSTNTNAPTPLDCPDLSYLHEWAFASITEIYVTHSILVSEATAHSCRFKRSGQSGGVGAFVLVLSVVSLVKWWIQTRNSRLTHGCWLCENKQSLRNYTNIAQWGSLAPGRDVTQSTICAVALARLREDQTWGVTRIRIRVLPSLVRIWIFRCLPF